ncbi:Uma2 family endonuclease [Leptolyngbya cf. ectocarpi LEGE 11479]|uniref:Uma2 family endonuclease n=1 Tax=Leptolyngbya cf. ectocarpi LEGE 11479 TaxID=1828722 RepID=A0A928X1V0_LEPEC|nr:Uma2 family endonuclease [Leptolyngbya ectocarpi]MBE9066902.1 Uma2 family endonuclease [Leptolyngbya cf. ectocarpi LEGE 11479]
MVQAVNFKRMTFDDFIQWVPDDGKTYELHQGVVTEMQPTGPHELVGAFIAEELTLAIRQRQLAYTIPKSCLLKPRLPDSGYRPDVAVLDKAELADEPLWETASTVRFGKSIPLVVEVVSTNWRDDYAHKLVEYEAMGIAEYWIVDFRALGAVRYIGQPKQPTITICQLVDEEYQLEQRVTGQQLHSSIFPELELTTDAIFQAAEL